VDPVRVGLVGAGPWARVFTAPLLARGPDCTLAAVWARRRDQAAPLAARHGAVVSNSFDDLLATCDAVAFSVPPDVQADLAARAAAAGRPVLLEKPVGLDLDEAERLTDALESNGVVSQLVLTNRYRPSMRRFLDEAAAFGAAAGRGTFLGGGAIAGGYFATPWRLEHGAVFDLGPHVLDALDTTLGPIMELRAAGEPLGVVAVTCRHDGGAVSQATMSVTTPVEESGLVVELFGPGGRLVFDSGHLDTRDQGDDIAAAMATIASEFAGAVRTGVPHPLDVRRGLRLQRLIDSITRCLTT
jgi:predicted dehydrogenase